jgi:magnesium-transporting ATPase (P-type)
LALKIIERIASLCTFVLEYGFIVVVPMGILCLVFPDHSESIILITLAIVGVPVVLTVVAAVLVAIGHFVFGRYADEYERLTKNGEHRTSAFAWVSAKAWIMFVILLAAVILCFIWCGWLSSENSI